MHLLDVEGARPLCLRCRRPAVTCLCAFIPSLTPRTRFVFLMHPKEAKKTKNGSGRIAHLALADSELIVGVDFSQNRRVRALLDDPALDCRLLYPERASGAVAPGEAAQPRQLVLLLLDATWPCAKKMMKLSTNLHPLPRVSLTVTQPSAWLIKRQPDPRCLATIEAVDRTLKALTARGLEQYTERESDALMRPFHEMNLMARKSAADPERTSYRAGGGRPESVPRPVRPPKPGRSIIFRD